MHALRVRGAVLALVGGTLFALALLPGRAHAADQVSQGPTRGESVPCASSDAAMPRGLAVVLPPGATRDPARNLEALRNPFMSAVAIQLNWRDLESVQDKPDWSRLDALFAAAESANKSVILEIVPGFFSPAWALRGAQTDTFEIQYGPGHGTSAPLPMPWDSVYLQRWFTFVKQLAGRYGRSPAFRMIGAAGPTSVSAEMTLPSSRPPANRKWFRDGYTPAKYLAAWEDAFQVYADAFPNQCISLAGPNVPILAQGRFDRVEKQKTKEDFVERAVRAFGRRLALQSNDLHAGRAPKEAFDDTDFINSYSGRIITGFMMRGGTLGAVPSQVMGAAGDPPLALRRSIDKGMAPNKAGQHVMYLEIYAGDVRAPEMQPVLEYGASLFRK
jgi:hypothetical protein